MFIIARNTKARESYTSIYSSQVYYHLQEYEPMRINSNYSVEGWSQHSGEFMSELVTLLVQQGFIL